MYAFKCLNDTHTTEKMLSELCSSGQYIKQMLTDLIRVTPTMTLPLRNTKEADENKPRPVHLTVNYTGDYPIW